MQGRNAVFESLVRQGLLGMPWRARASVPVRIIYGITEEEIESEVARQRRSMLAVVHRTSTAGNAMRHRLWCASCAVEFWQETTAKHPWHECMNECYWCHECVGQRRRGANECR
jgi:hypothetical protein